MGRLREIATARFYTARLFLAQTPHCRCSLSCQGCVPNVSVQDLGLSRGLCLLRQCGKGFPASILCSCLPGAHILCSCLPAAHSYGQILGSEFSCCEVPTMSRDCPSTDAESNLLPFCDTSVPASVWACKKSSKPSISRADQSRVAVMLQQVRFGIKFYWVVRSRL